MAQGDATIDEPAASDVAPAPVCALCGRPATSADWCPGCKSLVCAVCDLPGSDTREMRAFHAPAAHQEWIREHAEAIAGAIVGRQRAVDVARHRRLLRLQVGFFVLQVVVQAWWWIRGGGGG